MKCILPEELAIGRTIYQTFSRKSILIGLFMTQ